MYSDFFGRNYLIPYLASLCCTQLLTESDVPVTKGGLVIVFLFIYRLRWQEISGRLGDPKWAGAACHLFPAKAIYKKSQTIIRLY
jgi:hypothetical protein